MRWKVDRVTGGQESGALFFDEEGVLREISGEKPGAEVLFVLGRLLGDAGRVGLGSSATPEAGALLEAAAAGVVAAGGEVWRHALPCPAQGADLAERFRLPVSLFVQESDHTVQLHLFDRDGLPPEPAAQRQLERELLRAEVPRGADGRAGRVLACPVTPALWAQRLVSRAKFHPPMLRRPVVSVGDATPEDRALRLALGELGCRLEPVWRPGIPAFRAGRGGFRLTAQDERGVLVDARQLLVLLALIEMENGSGTVAVPAGASAAVDLVAAGYGGTVLRLGRDGALARARYAQQPWMRRAADAAVRICSRMGISGQSLEVLLSKTPRFSSWQREVPLSSGWGAVVQAMARESGRQIGEDVLQIRTGGSWISLSPSARRSALRVVAEGPDLEVAAELCDFYAGRVAALDREISEQAAQEGDKK